MSYIRCLSNPEGLYIWSELEGKTAVSVSGSGHPIVSYLPTHVFKGLFLKFAAGYYRLNPESGHDMVSYRGAWLKEQEDLGHWALFYKTWKKPILAWQVTWAYVAQNVVRA